LRLTEKMLDYFRSMFLSPKTDKGMEKYA